MSNKLQFVAASQLRYSDRRKQPTKVCWTPENLVYAVLNALLAKTRQYS